MQQLDKVKHLQISTARHEWHIPYDCKILRLLITRQQITANDLCFASSADCQCFIRELFLLSFADEQISGEASPIADLGRALLAVQVGQTN